VYEAGPIRTWLRERENTNRIRTAPKYKSHQRYWRQGITSMDWQNRN